MSKRARITLDPELDETGSAPASAPKAAAKGAAQAKSAPATAAEAEPRAGRSGNAKAKPKEGAGAQMKPRTKAGAGSKITREPVTELGQEPPAVQAARPAGGSKAEAGRRPFVSAAPHSPAAPGPHDEPAVVTPPSKPEAGMFNLGTVLKAAVVGLVVVSVVLWLKRRP